MVTGPELYVPELPPIEVQPPVVPPVVPEVVPPVLPEEDPPIEVQPPVLPEVPEDIVPLVEVEELDPPMGVHSLAVCAKEMAAHDKITKGMIVDFIFFSIPVSASLACFVLDFNT